jgi:pectate lyase
MTKTSCSVATIVALLVMPATAAALPTFPGAEGSAAEAVGGRGGAIYIVDTLSDDPADGITLREAVEASGPRIIVFAVSGWIDLGSPLLISNANLTIAGQTSPGGVGVRGQSVRVETSEVVVMHMRFAAGSLGGDGFDSLQIWGPADNVMIDHSSMRWGCDESGETAYNPLRVTISWSVIGPGLNGCTDESNHNLGFLVWGGNDTLITFHHNFFPHNRYRNPEVNGGADGDAPTVDMVNNVGFDSFGAYTGIHTYAGDSRLNVIHNWFKLGTENNADAREGIMLGGESADGDGSYYVVGNAGAWRASWDDARPGHGDWDSLKTEWNGATPDVSWMRSTPHPLPGITVTRTNITEAYASTIVAESGATRPVIDSADAAYKSDYEGGVQAFLDGNVIGATAGSYPTLDGPAPPADTDADGMADAWESARGLALGTDDSVGDDDDDGYTNIEEYLHLLGGYASGTTTPPPDGGVGSDGGAPRLDGGSPDGGLVSSPAGGCGCRAANHVRDGVGISGALLMAVLALRRSRRR